MHIVNLVINRPC